MSVELVPTPSRPRKRPVAHRLIPPDEWAGWPDDKLLDLKISELGVTIEGSPLEARIGELQAELDARGLTFQPHFWLSAEWFSPDGVPGVAIPFYLAHPRLAHLERTQMLEVEGGTPEWCMKILRHEAGHAIDNAYKLRQRRRRQQIFGPSYMQYPGVLHAEAVQQELRPASGQLVRAEPSRRRLRRELCSLAQSPLRLAESLRRLAGAKKAGVYGRADA